MGEPNFMDYYPDGSDGPPLYEKMWNDEFTPWVVDHPNESVLFNLSVFNVLRKRR